MHAIRHATIATGYCALLLWFAWALYTPEARPAPAYGGTSWGGSVPVLAPAGGRP